MTREGTVPDKIVIDVELLNELVSDLEAEIDSRFKDSAGQIHPALHRRTHWQPLIPPAPHSNGGDALPSDAKSAGGEELVGSGPEGRALRDKIHAIGARNKWPLTEEDEDTIGEWMTGSTSIPPSWWKRAANNLREAFIEHDIPLGPLADVQEMEPLDVGQKCEAYIATIPLQPTPQPDAIGEDVAGVVALLRNPWGQTNNDRRRNIRKAANLLEKLSKPAPSDIAELVERLRRGPYVTVGDVTDLMDLTDWQELADEAAAALLATARERDELHQTCVAESKRMAELMGQIEAANEQNQKLRAFIWRVADQQASFKDWIDLSDQAHATLNRSEGQ